MADAEICNAAAIRQAARHVSQMYDEALAPAGVGLNQFSILTKLKNAGPSSIGDLAQMLVMDRSTLGHLLRPLETRGLVELGVAKSDRRSRQVSLTKAGRDTLAKALPLWTVAQNRFERTFGKDASRRLRQSLKQVAITEFRP